MDFITHLPSSHGFATILVVVDRFSKGVHLGALPTHYTAYKVANLFLEVVCKHHRFPISIISNRNPIFISSFWSELFKLSGTSLCMSTAYHPQMDGQTEVMNRTLEQYLRSFVHQQPTEWHRFLALAEWSYNTSQHSSGKGAELCLAKLLLRFQTILREPRVMTQLTRCFAHGTRSMKSFERNLPRPIKT